jgi:hypothetical protein
MDSEHIDRRVNGDPTLGETPETEVVLSDDVRGEQLSQLTGLIELMRPGVQADGGDLALLYNDGGTSGRAGEPVPTSRSPVQREEPRFWPHICAIPNSSELPAHPIGSRRGSR